LDDSGWIPSQLSEAPAAPKFQFIAAGTDDFLIADPNPPLTCRITTVRVAFIFFGENSGAATPTTTWSSVFVNVYPDSSGQPAGQPDNMGNPGTTLTQEVPMSALVNQSPGGFCQPYFVVDIPVSNIIILKNTTYWLSVVPRYPAPPQTAWMLSQTNTAGIAKFGFPVLGVPFWTAIAGNDNNPDCAAENPPPTGTDKNLSFVVFAEDVESTSGACCNTSTGTCTIVAGAGDCVAPDVFTLGATCEPNPCIPAGSGACCDPSTATCSFVASESECAGQFTLGMNCESVSCTPPNDACPNLIVVKTSVTPFSTIGATTDGPPECPIDNDIWFRYTAGCDGMLTVSLCSSTNYDSALAIYDGFSCPAFTALACDDNFCGSASQVSIPSTFGHVYLIRVGGTAGASGTGQMTISCIPTGSGACCHAHQSCEVLAMANCVAPDDVYTDGQPCSPLTCPPIGACCLPTAPCQIMTEADCTQMSGTYQGDATTCTSDPCPSGGPECCLGDINNDCNVTELDIPGFVDALLIRP
jgi:hypothetical protein